MDELTLTPVSKKEETPQEDTSELDNLANTYLNKS